jgi:hypothetical protein
MPRELHYMQCDRPLGQMIDTICQTIREHRIEYVVVDSIVFACGGNPESSEVAAQYAMAVRSFGVGSLHLAHVPKTGDRSKPFGSTFWHNAARSTWYLEPNTSRTIRPGLTKTMLEWHHRKANFGPLESETRLIHLTFDQDDDCIRVADDGKFGPAKKRTTAERLRDVLAEGSKSRHEVMRLLPDVKPDTVKKTIQRGVNEKWLDDANGRIGLRLNGQAA